MELISTHFNGDQTYTSASTDPSPPFRPFSALTHPPVVIYSSGPALADNFRMFSSAPFPQDVAFSGYLDQWRKLFAISVAFPAHHSHPGANLDFYACVKEVGALWNLHSDVNTGCIIRSSAPFDTQLLTVLTMSLNGEILSTQDRYSMLNLKELFPYSKYTRYVVGPEVDRAGIEPLLRFVWRSECNVQTLSCYFRHLSRRPKASGSMGQRHRQKPSSPLLQRLERMHVSFES